MDNSIHYGAARIARALRERNKKLEEIKMSNKDYENPRPPEFHEQMPWEPFKSNTPPEDPLWQKYKEYYKEPAATGDEKHVAADDEETPVCPFRKRTYFRASDSAHEFYTYSEKAEFMEEEFQPCLEEKCAMYKSYCGLKNI